MKVEISYTEGLVVETPVIKLDMAGWGKSENDLPCILLTADELDIMKRVALKNPAGMVCIEISTTILKKGKK